MIVNFGLHRQRTVDFGLAFLLLQELLRLRKLEVVESIPDGGHPLLQLVDVLGDLPNLNLLVRDELVLQ